jgi:hypothetical protein
MNQLDAQRIGTFRFEVASNHESLSEGAVGVVGDLEHPTTVDDAVARLERPVLLDGARVKVAHSLNEERKLYVAGVITPRANFAHCIHY